MADQKVARKACPEARAGREPDGSASFAGCTSGPTAAKLAETCRRVSYKELNMVGLRVGNVGFRPFGGGEREANVRAESQQAGRR